MIGHGRRAERCLLDAGVDVLERKPARFERLLLNPQRMRASKGLADSKAELQVQFHSPWATLLEHWRNPAGWSS